MHVHQAESSRVYRRKQLTARLDVPAKAINNYSRVINSFTPFNSRARARARTDDRQLCLVSTSEPPTRLRRNRQIPPAIALALRSFYGQRRIRALLIGRSASEVEHSSRQCADATLASSTGRHVPLHPHSIPCTALTRPKAPSARWPARSRTPTASHILRMKTFTTIPARRTPSSPAHASPEQRTMHPSSHSRLSHSRDAGDDALQVVASSRCKKNERQRERQRDREGQIDSYQARRPLCLGRRRGGIRRGIRAPHPSLPPPRHLLLAARGFAFCKENTTHRTSCAIRARSSFK